MYLIFSYKTMPMNGYLASESLGDLLLKIIISYCHFFLWQDTEYEAKIQEIVQSEILLKSKVAELEKREKMLR